MALFHGTTTAAPVPPALACRHHHLPPLPGTILYVQTATRFGPRDALLLATLAGFWGFSFLFIEVALRAVAPLWIVSARVTIGAAVLLTVLAARRVRLPRGWSLWRHLVVLGVLNNAVPWTAVAWAQQSLPSGLTALLMALVPLSTLLVSVTVGLEQITSLRLIGLAVSLGGVALIVLEGVEDIGRIIAMATVMAATLLYATGTVYAKRHVSGRIPALSLAAGQVSATAVLLVPFSLLVAPLPTAGELNVAIVGSLVALGALGTGFAFLLFYTLVERVGATNATMVTYLVPVIAVIAGIVVLGEELGTRVLVGGAVVVAGIWVTQRGLPRSAEEAFTRAPR